MKTRIVYVLVSDSDDYYYEQTLISAWSARYWNPNMRILCVVDELTDATLKENRTALLEIIDEKIVVNLSEGGTAKYTRKERSRMLKTNLRSYVDGDILYVDTDTIVCGSLAEVDAFQIPFGAVDDSHSQFDPALCSDPVVHRAKLLGYDVSSAKNYFNSGVMYMKDTEEVHAFTDKWHALYMKGQKMGLSFDQPSFISINNVQNLITPLDGIYNCQILNGGLPYLADAKILHYYDVIGNKTFFALSDPAFLSKTKKCGNLTEEDKLKIIAAKRQIQGEYVLVHGNSLRYWHSSLRHLFLNNLPAFKFLEFISRIIRRLCKTRGKCINYNG